MGTLEVYTFTKKLRQAVVRDFWIKKQRTGRDVYYLKSLHTQQIEGPYLIYPNTDLQQIAHYIVNKMLYIEITGNEVDEISS